MKRDLRLLINNVQVMLLLRSNLPSELIGSDDASSDYVLGNFDVNDTTIEYSAVQKKCCQRLRELKPRSHYL